MRAQQEKIHGILERLPLAKLDLSGVGAGKTKQLFDRPEWASLSESCLGCGTCTFVCPTCQCYDVQEFDTFMAAVIDKASFETCKGYIDRAAASPECEFIAGGTYDDSKGWFIQPTIIRCKTPTYESMVKEIFGPIVSIYVYDDDKLDETLAVCDSASPYALTGAIFAQDRTAIVKMENALRNASGNFYINDKCTGAIVGQQPFGGARASGTNDKAGTSLNIIRWLSAHSVKESFCPSSAITYPYMSEK